jgi:hypothetical protein
MSGLIPWQPVSLTMETVRSAGAALIFADFILAGASAGCFVLRCATLQSGRAGCASDRHGRARLVAQADVAIAHNHLRGHSSRAGQSLAIGLGGPPGRRHELDHNFLRGIAPSKSLWPRVRRLLSNGSALVVSPL